jgi:hypothetical protein
MASLTKAKGMHGRGLGDLKTPTLTIPGLIRAWLACCGLSTNASGQTIRIPEPSSRLPFGIHVTTVRSWRNESALGSLVGDRRGRMYGSVFLRHRIMVLDSAGKPLDSIGREGRGPGEIIGTEIELRTDPFDTLFVFDVQGRRLTVIDERHTVVRLVHLPFGGDYAGGIALTGNGTFVFIRNGVGLGIASGKGVMTREFGYPTGRRASGAQASYSMDDPDIRHSPSPSSQGRFWSPLINKYRIERWDTAGRLLTVIEREPSSIKDWRGLGGYERTPMEGYG